MTGDGPRAAVLTPPAPPAPPPAGLDAGRIYLGWQHALLQADPGPPPRRPPPPDFEQVNPDWEAAQRREYRHLTRRARQAAAGCAGLAGLAAAAWLAGWVNPALAVLALLAAAAGGTASGRELRLGAQRLGRQLGAERDRVAAIRAIQQSRMTARQEQHARAYRAWQQRRAAAARQPQWFAVSLPADLDRVDVAGGTLAGWSALLTTIAAPRLAAGGEVTVLDLTEGAVAADLVAVARRSGIDPLVWVLPADLPRLDLGAGLGSEALADVLAQAVSASEQADAGGPGGPGGTGGPGGLGDAARDAAILSRVLAALAAGQGQDQPDGAPPGPPPQDAEPDLRQLVAGLRILAEIDSRAGLDSGLLTGAQVRRISGLFGRGAAERVVLERAWALESRLAPLERLGSARAPLAPSRLRVAWLDRRSPVTGGQMLGTYLAVALTHLLRQAGPGRRWEHTLVVLGAERLGGVVLDRLCDAAEISGTGLVLGYRSLPGHVATRLGRGSAAVAYMRLGNGQDAAAASEQIGTEHRFVLAQLTDTVGDSLTGTTGDSYTSTVGTADSVADSRSVSLTAGRSRGRGRSRHGAFAPFAGFTGSASRDVNASRAVSDSVSVTEGINTGTSWGISTSQALSASTSLASSAQRSREFLVEKHELQQLPASAVIVTHAAPGGRRVVLADANPAIIALPAATLASLDEVRAAIAAGTWQPPPRRPSPAAATPGQPAAPEPPAAAAPGPAGAPESPAAPESPGSAAGPAPDAWPGSAAAGDAAAGQPAEPAPGALSVQSDNVRGEPVATGRRAADGGAARAADGASGQAADRGQADAAVRPPAAAADFGWRPVASPEPAGPEETTLDFPRPDFGDTGLGAPDFADPGFGPPDPGHEDLGGADASRPGYAPANAGQPAPDHAGYGPPDPGQPDYEQPGYGTSDFGPPDPGGPPPWPADPADPDAEPPPNLGPPPERLDWRKRRQ